MSEAKINIGNSQREKIITKELKITKNVFIYNNSFIPLTNISRVGMLKAPKDSYSIMMIVLILIGAIMIFSPLFLIGMILLGVGIYSTYSTYKNNQDLGEYLVLSLNSGRDVYLYSKDHEFTVEVMDVMINCLNSGGEYKINMENCQIEACQFGEGNYMVSEEKK